jgi:hypothetical protein
MPKLPNQYTGIQKRYKSFMKAVENLGKSAKATGPLNKRLQSWSSSLLLQRFIPKVRCTPMRGAPCGWRQARGDTPFHHSPHQYDRLPHCLGRALLGRRCLERKRLV